MEKEIRKVALKISNRKNKFSSIEKNRILYLYHNYHDTNKLVEYLNKKYNYFFTYSKLTDFAFENNIKKKAQNMYAASKVTRKDEQDIIKLYKSGYSSEKIANLYNYKTGKSILDKLKKFNVLRRGSNEVKIKNKSYSGFSMKIIDSELKGYFLGLLLTDGYICEDRGYIGIELTDLDVIKFLSEQIKTKYVEITPKGKAKLTKYRITLYSKDLLNDLKRLGVVYKKTYNTSGPDLYEHEMPYINSILRGIMDGDGWVRKDGNEFFICSASHMFIKWCQVMMIIVGFINLEITFLKNQYNGIYLIRTASKYNIEILRQKIYNKPFGMMRKYNRVWKKDVQRL